MKKSLTPFQQQVHDLIIEYATTIYFNSRGQHANAKTAKDYTESLERYLPKEAVNRFHIPCPDTVYNIQDINDLQQMHDSIESNPEWKQYDIRSHGSTFRSGLKCLIALRQDKGFLAQYGASSLFSMTQQSQFQVCNTSAQKTDGKPYEKHCNGYERNSALREECLKYYGYKCQICGFDFFETYGEIGKDFIEVHHLDQLAIVGQAHAVDPIIDLVPVCSNCHSMLHRKTPPYTPVEIRNTIKNN